MRNGNGEWRGGDFEGPVFDQRLTESLVTVGREKTGKNFEKNNT